MTSDPRRLLLLSQIWALLRLAGEVHGACSRTTTALTTDCEDQCYEGRPCIAYVAGQTCNATTFSTCTTDTTDECVYECFKNGPTDYVANGIVDFSAYEFLIPFGSWRSSYDDSTVEARAGGLTQNDTDLYPSKTNDVLTVIEPLSLLTVTTSVTIAGGTSSTQGTQGKVVQMALGTTFLEGDSQLTDIVLANLGLDTIPASTFPTTNLVNFTVSNCLLDSLPTDLLSMTKLKYLDLSKNYLKDYPVKFSIANLRQLNLSTNGMTSFEGTFPNLTTLDLSANTLATIPTSVFSMAKLKNLYLSDNSFTDVTLSESQISFLKNLTTLSIDSFGTLTCSSSAQIEVVSGVSVCLEGASSSSSAGTSTTTSSKRSSKVALYTAIGGGLVLIIGLTIIYILCRRRRQSRPKPSSLMNSSAAGSTQKSGMLDNSSLWNDNVMLSLQVNSDEIEDINRIGNGAFGVVYLCKYRKTRFVASKRLKRDQATSENTKRFIAEIKTHAKLDHPRIVTLVGVAWTIESDLQALFEYMENGDLRSYLQSENTPLHWTAEKLQIAIDIVEALVYVHSFVPPLVHRDLKSRNVLLAGDMRAKLSDFGVARYKSEANTMTSGVGTGRWLAPEVIAGSNDYDESCDIFAFGVVLSEIDTHALPYENLRGTNGNQLADVAVLQMVAAGNLLPSFNQHTCPVDLLHLALRCLSFDRKDRPTAVEVAYSLRTIQKTQDFYVL